MVVFNDQFFNGYPKNLGWPPRKIINFLNLQTIQPVPEEYRKFAGALTPRPEKAK